MESWLYCWSLAALLCSAAGEPNNGTDPPGSAEQADEPYEVPAADILASLLEKGVLDVEAWRPGGDASWSSAKAKKPQKKLPKPLASTISPGGAASDPSGIIGDGNKPYTNGKSPSRALLSESSDSNPEPVTSFVWPLGRGTVASELRKSLVKGDRPPMAESQEDSGSGDPHLKVPSGQVTHSSSSESGWDLRDFMDMATSSPHSTTGSSAALGQATERAISPDSAEMDHLLPGSKETSVQSPAPAGTGFQAGRPQGPFTDLENVSARGAQGGADTTEKPHADTPPASLPPNSPPRPSEPPSDLTDIDYRDRSELDDHHMGYHPDSTKDHRDHLRPWPKHLYYDDFSPFDYVYPTPPFYADGYEDGGIEDDEDDDLEEAEDLDDDEVTSKDIRNLPKAPTLTPKIQSDEKPTGRQDFPKYHPEGNKDHTQTMAGGSENGTECRNGYIRRNNSCKSLCEIYPTYCYNGGQCYIVENIGAFCRCNTQDYIWHKGLRCESIITDFQVMCVAVGAAALVLLLLFMMTVFFAKKLYLLKTENYKLRKRNRYRTPSELHNDNFSLSTIAEGSHPNEDPNAPQKVQDLPKACLKDEEPFNIQNSLSPKHECSKGDPDIVDVNCVLNNLT